ncbi:hypothetical protein [Amycolatopsis jejuensis]|uniref:hypothetical protein n=1 Tax=Amycolatopsis jejuensis TaxID=330084 RepID=UPI0005264520|nr:hypothetical protein [Amycolatopsis jejuensis]
MTDAWKTPEIREAEAALDRSVRSSRELLKELDKIRLKPLPRLDTPERVEAIKKAASRPDAPAELRVVKRKVDAGELTWADVATGRAFADPEVRALASDRLGEAKDILEELEEGLTAEEVLEARTGSRDLLADAPSRPVSASPDSAEDPLADDGSARPGGSAADAADYAATDPLADHGTARPAPGARDYAANGPHADRHTSHRSAPDAADHAANHPLTPPGQSVPPRRHGTEPAEDDFTDPLAERGSEASHSPGSPPSPSSRPSPPSSPSGSPPSAGRRVRREDPGDDDYFGNSPLG